MLKFRLILLALVAPAVAALAQDAPQGGDAPAMDMGDTGVNSLFSNSGEGDTSDPFAASEGDVPDVEEETPVKPESEPEKFELPGGFGEAPETLLGAGGYSRPPLRFSATVQHGYDDNIYSTSGKIIPAHWQTVRFMGYTTKILVPASGPGTQLPKKGSMISQAFLGLDALLSQDRFVFSMGLNAGLSYYWDRMGNQLDPNDNLRLMFAYKATPRLQLSGIISAAYLTQPDYMNLYSPTQTRGSAYINYNSKVDALYRWGGRTSTDTTLNIGGTQFMDASERYRNYVDITLGQSFRYALSPRMTAVLEGRHQEVTYETGLADSTTEYFLGGVDYAFTQRFSSTLRVGESLRQYAIEGSKASDAPYMESSMTYSYGGKGSSLAWRNRFGSDEGNNVSRRTQSFRSTLSLSHVFTAKLSASLGVSYNDSSYSSLRDGESAGSEQFFSASLGVQYAYNRSFTFFGNFTHNEVASEYALSSYSRNSIFLGTTYNF